MDIEKDPLEIVQKILNEIFDLPKEVIKPDTDLREDLGLDSIDAIDLIVLLEKETDCKIAMDDLIDVKTVEDIINKVKEISASAEQ
ncbi:MAG: acyl carrier protein [Proteobacteria bacterium]|nr:acyl carrier protein [Pseudomonadota bacterium]